MKRLAVIMLLAVLVQYFGVPFRKTDVAKLKPVELIALSIAKGRTDVRTEGGDFGSGYNLQEALEDMKRTADGEIFLETVNNILVTDDAKDLVKELTAYLRPGCGISVYEGEADLETAAKYLGEHKLPKTLLQYAKGKTDLPKLIFVDGRIYLEQ